MLINRKEAPAYRQIETVELIRPTEVVLANGLRAYVISAGEQELVRIEFMFKNTVWDPARPVTGPAANTMLIEGTMARTAAEISGFVDYYGAFLQTEYAFDQASVVLFTLNKHVEKVLPVVADILTNAVFPQAEVDTYVRNNKQKLAVSLQKNDVIARRELNHILFGDSPYGHKVETADYDALQRTDLADLFAKTYVAGNLTVIVSGKVTPDVIASLDKHIGSMRVDERAGKTVTALPQAGNGGVHLVEKPGALQSAIRMGKRAITRSHPDFPAAQVLMTIFGGYFGSRLMANIREDKGYTYGIGAGLAPLQQGGYFYIASEVGADVCKAAIGEIEKEIDILRTQPVPADELALVRNYMMGSFLGDLENAFSHADKFKSIHFYGLGYDYYDRYIETVKGITPEELMALANKYLDFETFEQVIVGKL